MSIETPAADTSLFRANRLDLLERIADGLAHEIKNPLHSMVINLEVLKRRVARSGAAETDPMLNSVEVLGSELSRIHQRVELLLRLTRSPRRSDAVDIGKLLNDMIDLVRVEAHRRGVTVDYEPAASLRGAAVSHATMQQVVLNLVFGALDALPRECAMAIRLEHHDDRVHLVVAAPEFATRSWSDDHTGDDMLDQRLAVVRALGEKLDGRLALVAPEAGAEPAASASLIFSFPATPDA